MSHQLNEGLLKDDLIHLVGDKIHFDEYESKMGDNDDVITASFKIKQRMPANDLVSFIENGYDWVLDADVSSGEISENEYLVFVEMPRQSKIFEQMLELLDDLQHLTDVKLNEWKFRWYKDNHYHPLDETSIKEIVPDSPERYRQMVEQYSSTKQEQNSLNDDLIQIKKLSGLG